MEFGIDYFQCRISSTGRINYITLDARYFYRIYSVCKVLFSNFSGISLEDVDQGYNIDVVEEWLPDEDVLIITITPVNGEHFVQNIGQNVQNSWGLLEQGNIGFPLVRVYEDSGECVLRNAN